MEIHAVVTPVNGFALQAARQRRGENPVVAGMRHALVACVNVRIEIVLCCDVFHSLDSSSLVDVLYWNRWQGFFSNCGRFESDWRVRDEKILSEDGRCADQKTSDGQCQNMLKLLHDLLLPTLKCPFTGDNTANHAQARPSPQEIGFSM